MKHRINVHTGICSVCGLSNTQKLTSSCYGHQLTSDGIKAVTTGKIDYHVMYGWFNPNDFMKPHPTPKSTSHDVDNSGSMNYLSKSTYEIVGLDEFSPEVKEAINKIINNLGFTGAKPTTEELAAGIAEVFSEAFKTNESPDFSDDELELLQQIKDNPIPISFVLSFGLSKPVMDRLRTLHKYGAVTIHSGAYWVTQYGNDFLVEPEETEPVLLERHEMELLCYVSMFENFTMHRAIKEDCIVTLKKLQTMGLLGISTSGNAWALTDVGHDHIAKLCSIPL